MYRSDLLLPKHFGVVLLEGLIAPGTVEDNPFDVELVRNSILNSDFKGSIASERIIYLTVELIDAITL